MDPQLIHFFLLDQFNQHLHIKVNITIHLKFRVPIYLFW
jgi:hypothetical protein